MSNSSNVKLARIKTDTFFSDYKILLERITLCSCDKSLLCEDCRIRKIMMNRRYNDLMYFIHSLR